MVSLVMALSILSGPAGAPAVDLIPDLSPPQAVSSAVAPSSASPKPVFGGGGASRTRVRPLRVEPVVALLLGIFPGFGLGHFVAGDDAGFSLWLVVDIVLLAAIVVVGEVVFGFGGLGLLRALAWVAWLGVHVVQGLDAYAAAGGRRVLRAAAPGAPDRVTGDVPAPSPLLCWRF
ncbi:MAG: hypothetical protein D6729_17500 [Deltaproteobacteria bacterium]|nr:MAG: hypothetical protein D6729_17500 [Deltaproteobacteria bacterium]